MKNYQTIKIHRLPAKSVLCTVRILMNHGVKRSERPFWMSLRDTDYFALFRIVTEILGQYMPLTLTYILFHNLLKLSVMVNEILSCPCFKGIKH